MTHKLRLNSPAFVLKIIFGIVAVFLAIISLVALRDPHHWFENMLVALQVAAMALFLPIVIILYMWIHDRTNKRQPIRRLLGWISPLIFAISIGTLAAFDWTHDRQRFPVITIVVPLAIAAFFIGWTKKRTRSWEKALDPAADLNPEDEREELLLSRANRQALGIVFFLLLVLTAVIYFVPKPSKSGLIELLIALSLFSLAIRNFIAWRMGLK